jgi:peptidyl-prolyl cis-trans isomerase C
MTKKQTKNKPNIKLDNRVVLVAGAAVILLIAVLFFSISKKTDDENVIALINGKPVSNTEVNEFLKDVFEAPSNFDIKSLSATQQKNLVEQYMIERELLARAKKSSISADDAVKKKIVLAKDKILKKSFLENLSDKATSREVIEEEYRNLAITLENELKGKKEVKVKHILVKEQSEVNKLLLAIKSGRKTFEDVAKESSQDTHTGKNGGDLGYIAEGSMVKEFEEVAFSSKIGEISAPFKTDFGWHIIKVTDKRDAQVPSLEEVYFKIKQSISIKAINDYINEIKDSYQIELLSANQSDEILNDSDQINEQENNS